jgi:hypothetical protein
MAWIFAILIITAITVFLMYVIGSIAYTCYRYFRYGEKIDFECNEFSHEAHLNSSKTNTGMDLVNNPVYSYLPQNIFHDHFSNDYHSTFSSNDLFD